MSRTLVFCALVAILVASFAADPLQGFNSTCVNDRCFVYASTSPMGLISSGALIAFVTLYRQKAGAPMHLDPIKIWERSAAFFIDFFVVGSATSPIATLPILLTEADATGHFRWSFERDFSRAADSTLLVPAVLSMFAALFAYFYIHALIGRRTVGQYLFGFRVEGVPRTGKKPAFGLNLLLGYIGLCAWPVSVYLAAKRQDKAFWWNLRTRTQLVRVV